MQQTDYRLITDYIELNQLLKVCGLAGSGGEGGALVTQGNVRVDGQPELRKRCKIRPGQVVQLGEVRITVLAADAAEVAARAEARIEAARVKAAKKKATRSPPGVWSPAGTKTVLRNGAKTRVKAGARVAPRGGTPVSAKTRKKSNVFADKAEAHRLNRKT
jgi:ribosome-associated protein